MVEHKGILITNTDLDIDSSDILTEKDQGVIEQYIIGIKQTIAKINGSIAKGRAVLEYRMYKHADKESAENSLITALKACEMQKGLLDCCLFRLERLEKSQNQ